MSTPRFPAFDQNKSIPALEKEILQYWKKNDVFKKSVEQDAPNGEFVFYDGPPFATGSPHYGHILQGTLKDLIPRYKTMQGYRVNRRFGWDCHGVPVEFQVEKENKIGGKPGIEAMGVGKFNEMCRSIVMRCSDEWKDTVDRMGRFVDYENDYKTMDPSFMESVWWVFQELWKKGLIYEGEKVLPYSPKLGSPLSNFEADQNYMDIDDPAVTLRFKVEGKDDEYFLAWTTTPWTLPANVGLGFGAEIEYSKVWNGEANYWVATDAIERYFDSSGVMGTEVGGWGGERLDIMETKKGKEFYGTRYEPLFDFFDNGTEERFLCLYDEGDYITTDAGTGIVHFAPSFGAEDADLCKKFNVYGVNPIGPDGYFDDHIPAMKGLYFRNDPVVEGSKEKNANTWVLENLGEKLFKREQIRHRYPHCYRTDCALMYRGVKTWFVNIQKLKPELLKQKENTNWVPSHLKDGRFGKGLETAPDWAISRNRYWGTPIPVWRDEDGHTEVIGSLEELEKKSGQKVEDLHRHFIDDLTWEGPNGKPMRRISEVLDCWFESGSMPYASQHYMGQGDAPKQADYIAEGMDQTRCWFYNLHALGTALFNQNMYKNVITTGLILAEDGAKMSKSKKNYPDPNDVFNQYGADSLRYYIMNSPVVRGENLRFAENGVKDVLKSIILPMRSVYQFFSTYANIDGWEPQNGQPKPSHELDRWILSALQTLIEHITEELDRYDIESAVREVPRFMDLLTNWYIRRSRKRFWASGLDTEKQEAYETLHHVLTTLSRLIAPIMPFLAEQLWQNLGGEDSVHLQDWPKGNAEWKDEALENKMNLMRDIVSLAAGIRARKKIKLRQPLQKLQFALTKEADLDLDVIKAEANVREVEILENLEGMAQQIVYVNARLVGKRLGGKVQEVIKLGKEGQFTEHEDGTVDIAGEVFTTEEYDISYLCEEGYDADANRDVVVLIDTNITEDLETEGCAREIIRAIQEMRKQKNFDVSDRIELSYSTDSEKLQKAFQEYAEAISAEVLAESISEGSSSGDQIEVDGESLTLDLKVV